MSPAERLQRYRERQLELLACYAELQEKIEQAVRAGQAELVAAQAGEARRLAAELVALEGAARHLAAFDGQSTRELAARVRAGQDRAVQAGRRARTLLAGALQELAAQIRELAGRPRIPLSPFARIGRPMLVDLQS
jgi:hypothetical protein